MSRNHSIFRNTGLNPVVTTAYLGAVGLLAVGAVTLLALNNAAELVLAPLLIIAAFLCMSVPRLAIYQYLFFLFLPLTIDLGLPVMVSDLSALLVLAAAVLDVLADRRLPTRLPPLSANFIWLLLAVLVVAPFGYDMSLSLRPLARLLFLTAVFLSLYRLSTSVSAAHLLKVFFWICSIHAAIAIGSFLTGNERSFGITGLSLDDMTMLAIVVGLSFFLLRRGRAGNGYLLGTLVVLGGLVSTQSRASLVFTLVGVAFLFGVSWIRLRRVSRSSGERIGRPAESPVSGSVAKGILVVVGAGVAFVTAINLLLPDVYAELITRFQTILYTTPHGTLRLRLELWRNALATFSDYPVLGLGPGTFTHLYQIIPGLHMHPLHFYIHGLSAHNLFLHYLAETGIVGASALAALFINLFRYSRRVWNHQSTEAGDGAALALYGCGFLFLVTTFLEAGWMWGQFGLVMVFFAALIVREYRRLIG